ncbi:hypothetical protein SDC9_29443 [bioreactor metagenome]|uniref:Uncharacterized protein n=1 Tax=bioreactor metagenome TaxID=1076179 RepID=A0A644UVQ5_9ZZZZ|nr:tRNA-intron lyase [Methanobrevibacter sp.]MEA4957834.1 tRNA-intron lyase [Methanobrevibacter sp.]
MRGCLTDDIVTITIKENLNQKAISLNQKSCFGKLDDDILELSIIEAFYLMENGRLNIYYPDSDEKIEINSFREIIKKKGNYAKYCVYKDLKERGYIIKTGFKYGSEFRLYERGKSPGEGHSDYLVKIIHEDYDINALDFASYIRVSHGVKKKLLMAVVDDEEDITYYKIEWTRP